MNRARHYLDLNRRYLKEEKNLLVEGDSVQASEKLWGASADIVKVIAARRVLELETHAGLWQLITKTGSELDDRKILKFFAAVNYLHQNFCENVMTPEAARASTEAVNQFIERVKELLTES